MNEIAVIGGGLTGTLLAIFLARHGYQIDVFERLPDARREHNESMRSINLAVSTRGWLALEKAGIGDSIKEISVPMKGRMIHDLSGRLTFQQYSSLDKVIYSVSRRALNNELLTQADQFSNLKIRFNETCASANLDSGELFIENKRAKQNYSKFYRHVFAADGAFSKIRMQMQESQHVQFSQKYLMEGYKELTISADSNGSYKMDKNALHVWPRNEFMLIALPNLNGSFTSTIFLPFEGEYSFSALDTSSKIKSFFRKFFPDFTVLIPDLDDQLLSRPASPIVHIQCYPWSYKDKYLLIGDAAHAIVPFYGQGMNCAFEDVHILDDMIKSQDRDWTKLFRTFEEQRKPNTDAISELSLNNYTEMRELLTKPEFILKKKIENLLNKLSPSKWTSLYSLVTFSNIPYKNALEEGKKQEAIMNEIMQIPDIENLWMKEDFLCKYIN
jgi:kynurenine 3-monooxygenase